MAEFDLVIRGGTVADGSGGELQEADVAVAGGRVAAVGKALGPGREELDVRGRLVTPGFVDIHTHYDGQITWEERMTPSSDHGVTSVVMGNCAIGFAPCRAEQRDLLMKVVAGVEDIPEAVMAHGVPWLWETFPEYLDFLDGRRADVDFGAQLPHAALRVFVMGERGAAREPPSTVELAEMTRLTRAAIEAGAIGASTSRTLSHRTLAGDLAPCETSGEMELMAIARGLREAGAGVLELIADFNDISLGGSAEFDMLKRLAREGNCPLSYTLVQVPQQPEAWRTLLRMTEQAMAEGLTIHGQIAPRAVGMCFGLDLSFNPFSFTDSYREIAHLPLDARVARLREPELRQRILAETPQDRNPLMLWLAGLYPQMFVLGEQPDYEPPPSGSVAAMAAARGLSAAELAYELLLEDDGRRILYLPITNFADGTLSVVREMIESDATIIALGDGGAHYGLICDASYSTFALSHWVRDRREGRFGVARMVRELTSKPAQAIGLNDRGLIRPGMKADINVIDFDRLGLLAPEVRNDLPGGGRRMVQRARGYDATIVSGAITYREGQATGALPGRLIRGKRDPARTRH